MIIEHAADEVFADHAGDSAGKLTHLFLSDEKNFGYDLTTIEGLEAAVADAVEDIETMGMTAARNMRFAEEA